MAQTSTKPPTAAPARRPPDGLSFPLLLLVRPPPWPRPLSVVIILALLALIGCVDYLTGVKVSLRVFYDLPIVLATSWFGWLAGALCAIGSVSCWLMTDYIQDSPFIVGTLGWWNAGMSLSAFLVVVWALDTFIRLQRDLDQRVRQRTAALERESQARAELQRELLLASGRERTAIGQDLHDGLCQHLVGTALAGQVLAGRLGARQAPEHDEASRVVRLIEEGIAQTRHLARGLLLSSIRPERLVAELEEFAVNISRQSGVPCRFQMQGAPVVCDEQTASHLFRIAEEAVRNALRHARPRSVEITLVGEDDGLTLTVADVGEGLPPTGKSGGGVGLRIMGHRAKVIGGELTVQHQPGRGTSICCHVPTAS